ncbi:hypothetical protein KOW79_014716 [Hemibagrus wyckioides]|uniref:Uncharacterized protein n=1 Tax=Hemibagrus wyckioides TaxID=337641 RepID=A0A9D3SJK7_9TELE|nr:hypothetical protein KOW79_014716 [Hemibagrus wyckioides]
MNQAPLIADFTLFGPIVSLHRRGFDSSGQAQGEGVDKKVSEALACKDKFGNSWGRSNDPWDCVTAHTPRTATMPMSL